MANDDLKKKVNQFAFSSVEMMGKYIAGKVVASIIVGVATFFFCRYIDIRPAWLLAIIAGLGNLIPIVGPWIVMIICALFAVFQDPMDALYISIFCIAIQTLDQFLITPLVVGKGIDLSPLVIIVVITVGSLFLGFWGLMFAIPIAAVVKIFYTIFIKNRDRKPASEEVVVIDKGDVD
ncbi:MAG: AI-2E family transporter [Clostridiales bacterium]|nr:AI-2E family transporter [Clostridiales bacterium]